MVLSGTLREFILADVMQLLTQQKITGKLLLTRGRKEGYILFKDGNVVNAGIDNETFSTKLYFFLTTIQQQPKKKTRELFSSYEGKLADLTAYLEEKGILPGEELRAYATSVVEDTACGLFLWSSGSYRFDSMRTVDQLIPAKIDIAVENIVMEAMRRIDEWHRMREIITEEGIFAHSDSQADLAPYQNPTDDPSSYFYTRINGTSTVKMLLQDSFLSEYKIYESIYLLLRDDLIRPLSDSMTRTIRAAIQRKEQKEHAASTLPPVLTMFVSIGCILMIILLSWLYRGVIFAKLNIRSTIGRNAVHQLIAEEHLRDGQLFLRTGGTSGLLQAHDELTSYPLITKRDRFFLSQKRGLDITSSGQYNK